MRGPRSSRRQLALALAAPALAATTGLGDGGGQPAASAPPIARALGRPYHVVLTSNRDGDVDVYAASTDGRRVAVLTRNGLPDDRATASPDGRWVAVARPRLVRPVEKGGTFLVSGDGRRSRLVGEDRGWIFHRPVAFSPDSRWLAVERERLLMEVSEAVLVPTRGGRTRVLSGGPPVSFSPTGRYLLIGRRVRDLRSRRAWPTGDFDEHLWAPDGRRIAFVRYRESHTSLVLLDLTRPRTRPRTILSAPELSARWIGATRLGFSRGDRRGVSASRRADLGVVSVSGAVRPVHAAAAYYQVDWSPRGDFVAYATPVAAAGEDRTEYRLLSADGRRSRELIDYPHWSPSGRRYVVAARRRGRPVLLVVDPRGGRVTRTLPWFADWHSLVWSPDERGIAGHVRRGNGSDIAVAELPGGRTHLVLRGGASSVVNWVAGPVPLSARPAPPPPRLETATPSGFRSEGRIVEIAASGPRVAALVDQSARDCDHAVAWTAGRRSVVRFSASAPCEGEAPIPYGEHFFALELTGTALRWKGFHCGNHCYHVDYDADVRRPGRQREGEEIGVDDERRPGHPLPRPETKRGVRMSVVGGAIRLRREGDGRTATIRPPGRLADADLEAAGLFYAYNVARGSRPGRLAFVRFNELLG